MKISRFLITLFLCWTCIALTVTDSRGETHANLLKRYSARSANVKQLSQNVEKPSSRSKRIASELIGGWEAVSALSSNDLAKVVLKNIVFRKDGTVRYTYELKDEAKTVSKTEEYQVFHRGAPRRVPGKAPNVIIKSATLVDDSVIALIGVSVGYSNRLPVTMGKVLSFTDLDGNRHVFVRDKKTSDQIQQPTAAIDLSTIDAIERGIPRKHRQTRNPDPQATRELTASLSEGQLTGTKKNEAILRLMNEGDNTCVPILIEHLKDGHSLVVRQNAIRALGKIGGKQAILSLVSILKKPVEGNIQDEGEDQAIIRRNAVLALGDIGDASSLPILENVAESTSEYQSVREFAEIAVRKIQKK